MYMSVQKNDSKLRINGHLLSFPFFNPIRLKVAQPCQCLKEVKNFTIR